MTGQDIIKNLKQNKANRDGIIIPSCALREGEDIFLDDYTLEDIKKAFPDEESQSCQRCHHVKEFVG